ncbi:DUF362 domain-containing protein [Candidatus Woesearchaeota archaeon]|nr:DUF362 domain-containing protein [Candidatus Woesearchaeota archaeon]
MSKVSLVHGNDRYSINLKALELIEDEIKLKLKGKKKVVIKPNFVDTTCQNAATNVEVVKAILDIITRYYNKEIIIAEGAFERPTSQGWKNYGYYRLEKEYDVEFVDLNEDDYELFDIYDENFKPIKVRVAKTVIDSDYRISAAKVKTHDFVIVTLSLKNILVGSLINDNKRHDKGRIHQGIKAINKSLFKLAKKIPPHLSVIDGFEAMQGDGPGRSGEMIRMNLAIASHDFLAADILATTLMGFNPDDIGYLFYCKEARLGEGDLDKVKIVGVDDYRKYIKKLKPHSTYKEQLKWKLKK